MVTDDAATLALLGDPVYHLGMNIQNAKTPSQESSRFLVCSIA